MCDEFWLMLKVWFSKVSVTWIIDASFRYSLILQIQDFFIEQYGILYKFFVSQESTVRFRISFYAFYLHASRSDFISVQNLGDTKALTKLHNTLLLLLLTVLPVMCEYSY